MSDLIDRQAALEAILNCSDIFVNNKPVMIDKVDAQEALMEVPTAEPKKGKWTNDASCPFCGFQPWYERDIHTLSFCPNCGADMRGEEDDHTAEEKAT